MALFDMLPPETRGGAVGPGKMDYEPEPGKRMMKKNKKKVEGDASTPFDSLKKVDTQTFDLIKGDYLGYRL